MTFQDLPISMIRPDLEDVPKHQLPEGLSIRWYQPGDGQHWLDIHIVADLFNTFSPVIFQQEFGEDLELLAQRQCYLFDEKGAAVGTATAWVPEDDRNHDWGRVHWVAIRPEMQGRGLSRPLMTVICQRLRELGHRRAYLTTSTARIPALNLYLGFGFVPEISSLEDRERWAHLRDRLKYPLEHVETSGRHPR